MKQILFYYKRRIIVEQLWILKKKGLHSGKESERRPLYKLDNSKNGIFGKKERVYDL